MVILTGGCTSRELRRVQAVDAAGKGQHIDGTVLGASERDWYLNGCIQIQGTPATLTVRHKGPNHAVAEAALERGTLTGDEIDAFRPTRGGSHSTGGDSGKSFRKIRSREGSTRKPPE